MLFGIGWLASRWDLRLEARQDERERLKQQRSTFKGLNLLLNEQPDQAIETLVKVAQLDPETVDLHFSLGNLFRRRGETERAIRMHQSLVEREDLPQDLKLQALAELGQDYLKAGLLDPAERAAGRWLRCRCQVPHPRQHALHPLLPGAGAAIPVLQGGVRPGRRPARR